MSQAADWESELERCTGGLGEYFRSIICIVRIMGLAQVLFLTGLTGFSGFVKWSIGEINPENPVNPVKKTCRGITGKTDPQRDGSFFPQSVYSYASLYTSITSD
ncbi:hypothetical protein [Spirosoma litoris]